MKGKLTLAILLVLAVVGGLAFVKVRQIQTLMAAGNAYTPPPESVSSVVVREEKWQDTLSAIGSVAAVQGVTITPDIPGTVREIAFESGALVKKGDLLVKLDTSSEEAQLRAVEAQMELARINFKRAENLRKENTVSESEFDAAQSALKQQEANADAIRTVIEKKTLRAPFDGKLGIRQVNLGQYLEAGKAVVSLQALSPVYLDFALPQQELSRLQTGMKVRLTTDAYPGQEFAGTLSAINPGLDESTRSIGLQATFPNSDQRLRPGMFARTEVILPEEHNVLVIPATSILSAPYGDSVYVIESKPSTNNPNCLVVRQQFVRTGRTHGDFLAIESGLKAGERVVSSGIFKLRNGMAVVENNNLNPNPSSSPQPSDS